MKPPIEDLEAFDEGLKCVNVIIEAPKGSHFKYVYTPELGLFRIKRALPRGMVFPFNFGFIPGTQGADGDPLDILIVNDEPISIGCLVRVRLLGVVEAEQTEHGKTFRNDRLVGAVMDEETPQEYLHVVFDSRYLKPIEFFFVTYNKLSKKEFKVLGAGTHQEAERMVREGMKLFKKDQAMIHLQADSVA